MPLAHFLFPVEQGKRFALLLKVASVQRGPFRIAWPASIGGSLRDAADAVVAGDGSASSPTAALSPGVLPCGLLGWFAIGESRRWCLRGRGRVPPHCHRGLRVVWIPGFAISKRINHPPPRFQANCSAGVSTSSWHSWHIPLTFGILLVQSAQARAAQICNQSGTAELQAHLGFGCFNSNSSPNPVDKCLSAPNCCEFRALWCENEGYTHVPFPR